jgi:Holliday junction resolvasome RuvABC DNA-binding subunit
MLAGALLDAEVKIGELTSAIPINYDRGNQWQSSTTATQPSKQEAITKMGFDKHQISRFQQMAQNPDIVEQNNRLIQTTKKRRGNYVGGCFVGR